MEPLTDIEKMRSAAAQNPDLVRKLLELSREDRQRTIVQLKAPHLAAGRHDEVEKLRRLEGYLEMKTFHQLR